MRTSPFEQWRSWRFVMHLLFSYRTETTASACDHRRAAPTMILRIRRAVEITPHATRTAVLVQCPQFCVASSIISTTPPTSLGRNHTRGLDAEATRTDEHLCCIQLLASISLDFRTSSVSVSSSASFWSMNPRLPSGPEAALPVADRQGLASLLIPPKLGPIRELMDIRGHSTL
jgi:hypothetical protein